MTYRRVFSQAYKSYKSAASAAFEKYLFFTNVFLSMSMSTAGDLIEQNYEIVKGEIDKIDFQRTTQMSISGMTSGIICHHWYKFIDKILVGRTPATVVKKLLLDQCISSPIIILSFFATVAIFEEDPLKNFNEEVTDKFWTLYKAEWMVWPPAQIINFYFLPTRYRVLYDNIISLGYDVYTSQVKHGHSHKGQKDQCKMQALSMTWRKLAINMRTMGPMTRMKRVVRVAFSEKYLFFTNVTISVSLSCLGDVLEQHYEIYTKDLEKYDIKRTMVMGFSGAALGTLCHHWYKVLDKFIIGKTFYMVVKKLTLDQIVFSPIMLITFFGSVSLFEDDPVKDFKEEVKDKFVTLYRAEWTVWPPAQIINFYFLPTKYRVLYDNTISLGYDIYTSQVKHCKKSKDIIENDS